MRPRFDFYTLCPQCESHLALTLVVKLQSSRSGSHCQCHKCAHEWICIQEWIYRELPQQSQTPRFQLMPQAFSPSVTAAAQAESSVAAVQQPQSAGAVPRPHFFVEPAMPMPQMVAQQQVPQQAVPAPHAWSYERQESLRPMTTSDR